MKLSNKYILIMLLPALAFISCGSRDHGTPRPRTFPRIDFPDKQYRIFSDESCGFRFEYPVYAEVTKETRYFDGPAPECWYNINFSQFRGTLYLTYYPVSNRSELDILINDSFELASKHDVKATSRTEIPLKLVNAGGLLFKIQGNVATQTQFFITDTTNHFLRGSLYFHTRVNNDSMQVIQDYIDTDVDHFLSTFMWTK
jgi:gliding motility-associated lipoprotein GldD